MLPIPAQSQTRFPLGQLLEVPASKSDAEVRTAIALWITEMLNDKAALPTDSAVAETDPLKFWGIAAEDALFQIAAKFNREMSGVKFLRPPDLIVEVLGRTVADLIDFIARLFVHPAANRELSEQLSIELRPTRKALLSLKIQTLTDSSLQMNCPGMTITPTTTILEIHKRRFSTAFIPLPGHFHEVATRCSDWANLVDQTPGALIVPQSVYDGYVANNEANKSTVQTIITFFLDCALAAPPLGNFDAVS